MDFPVVVNGKPEQAAPNRLKIVENPFRANRRRQNGGPEVDLACAVEAEASVGEMRISFRNTPSEFDFRDGDIPPTAAGWPVEHASVALRPERGVSFTPAPRWVGRSRRYGEVGGARSADDKSVGVGLTGDEAERP